jgi:hypothetical protein
MLHPSHLPATTLSHANGFLRVDAPEVVERLMMEKFPEVVGTVHEPDVLFIEYRPSKRIRRVYGTSRALRNGVGYLLWGD